MDYIDGNIMDSLGYPYWKCHLEFDMLTINIIILLKRWLFSSSCCERSESNFHEITITDGEYGMYILNLNSIAKELFNGFTTEGYM